MHKISDIVAEDKCGHKQTGLPKTLHSTEHKTALLIITPS